MSKAKSSSTTISVETQALLDRAEAHYKNRPAKLTLGIAIEEFIVGREPLGPAGLAIACHVRDLHLRDWLDRPIVGIGVLDIIPRWSTLALAGQYDSARWLVEVIRRVRNHAIAQHPELAWEPECPCAFAQVGVVWTEGNA